MELFSNRVGQRRFRFVVHAQNLLSHGVRPACQKAAFGRRGAAFHADNTGNADSLAAKGSNQRVSRGVIANSGNGQDTCTERREIIGGVGSAGGTKLSLAVFV